MLVAPVSTLKKNFSAVRTNQATPLSLLVMAPIEMGIFKRSRSINRTEYTSWPGRQVPMLAIPTHHGDIQITVSIYQTQVTIPRFVLPKTVFRALLSLTPAHLENELPHTAATIVIGYD